MAQRDVYNTIVVSENPRGRYFEGIINGTPLPGTVVQLDLAVAPIEGKHTYEVANIVANGSSPNGPIIVVVEDALQGKGILDAYVTGTQCRFYIPQPGDELLMIKVDEDPGAPEVGDVLMVQDATGLLLISTVTGIVSEPFVTLENLADPSADVLIHTMFSGY